MPNQHEIDAAKKIIEDELSGELNNTAIEKFINRINSEHFFDKTRENMSADDIALHEYINGLYSGKRENLFSALAVYKAEKILDIGTKAVTENHRNWGYSKEKPQYGLDLKDAKHNMDVVDKAVIYSTKLLNSKTVNDIEKINNLFAIGYFKNEQINEQKYIDEVLNNAIHQQHLKNKEKWSENYDKQEKQKQDAIMFSMQLSSPQSAEMIDDDVNPDPNFEDSGIQDYLNSVKAEHEERWAKTDLANLKSTFEHFFNDGNEVLKSNAPEFADIQLAPDGKTVQVSNFKEGFLENEKKIHEFVESKRVEEKNAEFVAAGKVTLHNVHNLSVAEMVENMATYLALANTRSHVNDELALEEHIIRSEADYNKRLDIINRDKENLMNNPGFMAFTLSSVKKADFGSKRPDQVLHEWNDYNQEVENSVKDIINDDEPTMIPVDYNKPSVTIDEMQNICKTELKNKFKINPETDYINDMQTASEYFTLRLLTEPGAKRTFFGKGTNWSDNEQRKVRTGLKADKNGNYELYQFDRAAIKMRNSLLEDKNFLSILAEGKPLDKMYEEYKERSRQRAADIGDKRHIAMLRKMKKSEQTEYIDDSKDFVISQKSLDYLVKTKNELDTLYKKEGKYRSKYMKDLYSELTELIDEASKNGNAKDGYTVKYGRIELLQVKSSTYHNERKGSFFKNPLTDRGKARLDIVEQLINKTTDIMKEKQPAPEKQINKQAPAMKN